MSQDPTSVPPPANAGNPYAAPMPQNELSDAGGDVERIRKENLKHEASIQGMGTLYVLGGIFSVLASILYLALGIGALAGAAGTPEGIIGGAILLVIGLVVGALGAAQFWTGLGLRKIKPAARIPGIIFACIGLLGFPIGTLISGYFLYLLVSQKGTFIFTPEYASVMQQTPHIKYRTSIIVWIFLGLLLFLIAVGIISLVVSGIR